MILGEKNGKGFGYEPDKRGKLRKTYDETTKELLAPHVDAPKNLAKMRLSIA